MKAKVAQSCQTQRSLGLGSPWNSPGKNTGVDCLSFSRGSSWPRDWICISCFTGRIFLPPEPPGKPIVNIQGLTPYVHGLQLCPQGQEPYLAHRCSLKISQWVNWWFSEQNSHPGFHWLSDFQSLSLAHFSLGFLVTVCISPYLSDVLILCIF